MTLLLLLVLLLPARAQDRWHVDSYVRLPVAMEIGGADGSSAGLVDRWWLELVVACEQKQRLRSCTVEQAALSAEPWAREGGATATPTLLAALGHWSRAMVGAELRFRQRWDGRMTGWQASLPASDDEDAAAVLSELLQRALSGFELDPPRFEVVEDMAEGDDSTWKSRGPALAQLPERGEGMSKVILRRSTYATETVSSSKVYAAGVGGLRAADGTRFWARAGGRTWFVGPRPTRIWWWSAARQQVSERPYDIPLRLGGPGGPLHDDALVTGEEYSHGGAMVAAEADTQVHDPALDLPSELDARDNAWKELSGYESQDLVLPMHRTVLGGAGLSASTGLRAAETRGVAPTLDLRLLMRPAVHLIMGAGLSTELPSRQRDDDLDQPGRTADHRLVVGAWWRPTRTWRPLLGGTLAVGARQYTTGTPRLVPQGALGAETGLARTVGASLLVGVRAGAEVDLRRVAMRSGQGPIVEPSPWSGRGSLFMEWWWE